MTPAALKLFIMELRALANATDEDADKLQPLVAGDVARGAAWAYRETANALERQAASRRKAAA
jgi:hypothetical protein